MMTLSNLTKTLYIGRIPYARGTVCALFCRHKTDDKKPTDPKAKPGDPKAAKTADGKGKAPAKTAPKKPAPPPKRVISDVEKMRALQSFFQEDNGLPVFLKGGAKDQILYRLTMGLCILGIILDVKLFLDLALK